QMPEIDSFNWNLARLFFGITAAWTLIGITCNCILLITTIRTRNLRTTCNSLIAICAVGDILHECGTLFPLPFLFGFYIEIDSDICSYIMFFPEMGIAIGCSCILCIGLDRMISVMFPIRYK
ncbi:hypothetical protein PMAYCL1PPCAC_10699, partial [Pristionchus mayeri]